MNCDQRMPIRISLVGVVVIIALACGGTAGRTPAAMIETPSASGMVEVGRIDDYASGEPVHFISYGFWLVRIGDDLILALSDRDTDSNLSDDKCRIVWRPDAAIDARYG